MPKRAQRQRIHSDPGREGGGNGVHSAAHEDLAPSHARLVEEEAGHGSQAASTSGHRSSLVVFDDLTCYFILYSPSGAFGQSKTASILLAVGVSRRRASDDVVSSAAVVNVAFAPESFNAAYAANKSIVLALTQGLSAELGGRWNADRACAPPLTRS